MRTEDYVRLETIYNARNYKPLDVVLARGEGVWVWDVEGNKYLDCLSAYSALNQGHRHPRIVKAMVEQAERLTLTSRAFRNDQLPLLAKELCELTGYEMMLPMNTGTEAVETALKAARLWGHRTKGLDAPEIIACTNNFHGRTITVISFSTEQAYRDGFGPFTPGFKIVPYGDAEALEAAITPNTAAFLVEPLQGEAGVMVPPDGYLKAVREICDRHEILFIADEIQSGLGRCGQLFACDWEAVKPDLITIGKALSGGMMPVSAVVGSREVLGLFEPGSHGSTFGGNPLGCAVAREALKVIVDEELPRRARELGDYFRERIRALKSPFIKEVRGKGLLIGVELTAETGPARPFVEALQGRGVLAKDTHGTVIRFAPPLVITKAEIDFILEQLAAVLANDELELDPTPATLSEVVQ
ncbi:MAG: ornithine--oxo-acid transaminase [Anaerolineae bacterium]